MSDLLEHLTEYSDFNPDEQAWAVYKNRFLASTPDHRQAEMRAFDQFVDTHDKFSRPTREAADVLARRRELGDLHALARKAGR
jgi:hypothetical protein